MAAPTPTTRQAPGGRILKDGYQTLITFARDPDVEFWERTVKPVGLDGGEPIKLTTMHNTNVHTFAPRQLTMISPGSTTVGYNPTCLNSILNNLLNQEDTITETYSDGSTYAYFGYLQKFERNDHSEGEMPEATVSFVATNRDSTGAEQLPVLTDVTGT